MLRVTILQEAPRPSVSDTSTHSATGQHTTPNKDANFKEIYTFNIE